jgi:hypothetical protein
MAFVPWLTDTFCAVYELSAAADVARTVLGMLPQRSKTPAASHLGLYPRQGLTVPEWPFRHNDAMSRSGAAPSWAAARMSSRSLPSGSFRSSGSYRSSHLIETPTGDVSPFLPLRVATPASARLSGRLSG